MKNFHTLFHTFTLFNLKKHKSQEIANNNKRLRAEFEGLLDRYPTAEQARQAKQKQMAQKRWDKTKKHFSGQKNRKLKQRSV